ncbi:MAG: restriction endonuclease [Sedimentitalea sp.]|nr:restriction endonuclease [Sedimentitalea sp.]
MPVPDYETLMRPVLAAFANGATNVSEILPSLIEEFGLVDEDATKLNASGQTTLYNRAHWARTYLSKAGLLQSPKRNHHQITDLGRKMLKAHPVRIDNKTLSQIESFQDWKDATRGPEGDDPHRQSVMPPVATDDSETPDIRAETAFREIESALVGEVIEAVMSLSPARFEKLVVDLLIAMGYGGGDLERGLQTNLSGDGGIDGVINEDELGLDAVYVQAKRYAPDNKVGRPALNRFVGSLTGEGAGKGVFVTTSDFSKDAVDYVKRVQHRIVLINGDRLARLMIKHEVGVRARKTYVLRSVDEDYFSET